MPSRAMSLGSATSFRLTANLAASHWRERRRWADGGHGLVVLDLLQLVALALVQEERPDRALGPEQARGRRRPFVDNDDGPLWAGEDCKVPRHYVRRVELTA